MNTIQLNLLTSFQKRKKWNFNIRKWFFFIITQQVANVFLLSILSVFRDKCNAIRRIHSTIKSDYNDGKIKFNPKFSEFLTEGCVTTSRSCFFIHVSLGDSSSCGEWR